MSRQLPRLTDHVHLIEHTPFWERLPALVGQLMVGAGIFILVYLALQLI